MGRVGRGAGAARRGDPGRAERRRPGKPRRREAESVPCRHRSAALPASPPRCGPRLRDCGGTQRGGTRRAQPSAPSSDSAPRCGVKRAAGRLSPVPVRESSPARGLGPRPGTAGRSRRRCRRSGPRVSALPSGRDAEPRSVRTLRRQRGAADFGPEQPSAPAPRPPAPGPHRGLREPDGPRQLRGRVQRAALPAPLPLPPFPRSARAVCPLPPLRPPEEPLSHPRPLPLTASPPQKRSSRTDAAAPHRRDGPERGCGAHFPLPARPDSAPAGALYPSCPPRRGAPSAVGCGADPPDPTPLRPGGVRPALGPFPLGPAPPSRYRRSPSGRGGPASPPAAQLRYLRGGPLGRAEPGPGPSVHGGAGAAGLRGWPRSGGKRRGQEEGGDARGARGGAGPAAPRGRTGGCGTPHRTSGHLAGGSRSSTAPQYERRPAGGLHTRPPGPHRCSSARSAPTGPQTPLLPPIPPQLTLPSATGLRGAASCGVEKGAGGCWEAAPPRAPPAVRGPCGATRGRCRPVGTANTGGAAGTAAARGAPEPPAVSRRPLPGTSAPPPQHLERRCPHAAPPALLLPPTPPSHRLNGRSMS